MWDVSLITGWGGGGQLPKIYDSSDFWVDCGPRIISLQSSMASNRER